VTQLRRTIGFAAVVILTAALAFALGGRIIAATVGPNSTVLTYGWTPLGVAAYADRIATTSDAQTGVKMVMVGGGYPAFIPAGQNTALVIKATPGTVVQALITSTGSTSVTCYDNASAASGNIIGVTPAATTIGQTFAWNYQALNGITCIGATGTSPAVTLSFF
jgi:hypothetical protein